MDENINTMATFARGILFMFILALLIMFFKKLYDESKDKKENKKTK